MISARVLVKWEAGTVLVGKVKRAASSRCWCSEQKVVRVRRERT